MTTPSGVPNLPLGALTLDTLASKLQDMSQPAMRDRAAERMPNIFDTSSGGNALNDLTPFGILTQIWSGFNSLVANADPADIEGPEDLPGLLIDFIESLPVIGELVGLLEAILGTYDGDDSVLLEVQTIFAPIRAIVDALTAVAGGTGGLGNFFPDLLGLMGNPTGLGSGTPTLGSLNSIPLLGPLITGLLDGGQGVNTLNLFGQLPTSIFGIIPASSIGGQSPNLLNNPGFDGAISMDGSGVWVWDAADGYNGNGCASTTADGTLKALLSNAVDVQQGQTINVSVRAKTVSYTGTGTPIRLMLRTYLDGAPVSTVDIQSVAGAGLTTFTQLSGSYTVPAGVDQVRLRPVVDTTATGGTVKFDFGELTKPGNGPFDGILSLFGLGALDDLSGGLDVESIWSTIISTILNPLGLFEDVFGRNRLQDVIDVGVQAILGGLDTGYSVFDWQSALTQFPPTNILGGGGVGANLDDTFFSMFDNLTSALKLLGVSGVGLGDFASAAQDTSFGAFNAALLSGGHEVILGKRTNNDIMGALERTTISNIKVPQLGTGSTPSSVTVNSTTSAIGMVRAPNIDTKGVLYWMSSGIPTGFFINFGKLNLDGTVTHLFQSGNLAAQLTSGWQWQQYIFPGVDQISHQDSENLIAEFVVTGGTAVSIAGLPMSWQTDHPVATTKRSGGTRNTAGGTPTLGTFTFTGNTPMVGFGRADVDPDYHPPEPWSSTSAGAFTYTIPEFARVAGNLIDWFAYGGGGGGQSGGYFAVLEGGTAGQLVKGTFVYGTDIPMGTTQLTGNVGDNASGGVNPFALQPGDNGNPTTINGLVGGFSTKTANGGLGGGQAGNSWNQAGGQGAASGSTAGYQVFGGSAVGVNQDGANPGGGGGSGYPAVGRAGAEGRVYFRARQP